MFGLVVIKKCVFFVPQPPPQIYDKQLDEREHTIEEWKGDCAVLICTFCLPGHQNIETILSGHVVNTKKASAASSCTMLH